MAVFSVIKYEGPNDVLVWKAKEEDFTTKSRLIVHESQEALLFKNGQALDLFGPGDHTLNTQNIPLLQKLVNLPFGGETPFHCEVYFINKVHSMDVRWGTSNPIAIQDPTYNIILPVSANGQFAVQVEDSRKLIVKLVGTLHSFTQDELIQYFRGILLSNIKDALAKRMAIDKISFLEIQAHLRELSDGAMQDLSEAFSDYGIKLVNFNITTIAVPEDNPSYVQLKESLAKKAEMEVMGYTYQEQRTFDVLESAAKNEGGGNGLMGAGLGLGMGVNLGGFVGQTMGQSINSIGANGAAQPAQAGQAQQTQNTCVNCGAPIPEGKRFCGSCGAEQINPGMVKCPACGEIVAQGKFCNNCGAPLQKTCPNCGAEVTGNFCSNCGTKMEE